MISKNFSSKCWYFRLYRQKPIFKSDFKITSFFTKCWYFWIYWQNTTFSKWSQNNDIFMEMLIFTYLWTKNDFHWNIDIYLFDLWTKTFFSKLSQKCVLSRNVNIYKDMDKKRFFKMISKTSFSSICLYFPIYEQKTIFSNCSYLWLCGRKMI